MFVARQKRVNNGGNEILRRHSVGLLRSGRRPLHVAGK
jgi:hypothetical protein